MTTGMSRRTRWAVAVAAITVAALLLIPGLVRSTGFGVGKGDPATTSRADPNTSLTSRSRPSSSGCATSRRISTPTSRWPAPICSGCGRRATRPVHQGGGSAGPGGEARRATPRAVRHARPAGPGAPRFRRRAQARQAGAGPSRTAPAITASSGTRRSARPIRGGDRVLPGDGQPPARLRVVQPRGARARTLRRPRGRHPGAAIRAHRRERATREHRLGARPIGQPPVRDRAAR